MSNSIVSTTTPRGVTFSKFSQLSFIPEDDAEHKWYSPKEKHSNRKELIQDTRRMQQEICSTVEDLTKEQLYKCIGIEVFLTQGLATRVQKERSAHVNAILSEQRLQEQQGINDIKKLRDVSRKSSQWSRNRARKLATGYSKLGQS